MQNSQETTQCNVCQNIPEDFICLQCDHNYCIQCLSLIYLEFLNANQENQELVNLNCQICNEITQMDQASTNALEEYLQNFFEGWKVRQKKMTLNLIQDKACNLVKKIIKLINLKIIIRFLAKIFHNQIIKMICLNKQLKIIKCLIIHQQIILKLIKIQKKSKINNFRNNDQIISFENFQTKSIDQQFCQTCNHIIQKQEIQFHNNHNIQSIKNAMSIKKQQLIEELKQFESINNKFNKNNQKIQNLQIKKNNIKQNNKQQFDLIKTLLQQKYEFIEAQIDMTYQKEYEKLMLNKENYQYILNQYKNAEKLLQDQENQEILNFQIRKPLIQSNQQDEKGFDEMQSNIQKITQNTYVIIQNQMDFSKFEENESIIPFQQSLNKISTKMNEFDQIKQNVNLNIAKQIKLSDDLMKIQNSKNQDEKYNKFNDNKYQEFKFNKINKYEECLESYNRQFNTQKLKDTLEYPKNYSNHQKNLNFDTKFSKTFNDNDFKQKYWNDDQKHEPKNENHFKNLKVFENSRFTTNSTKAFDNDSRQRKSTNSIHQINLQDQKYNQRQKSQESLMKNSYDQQNKNDKFFSNKILFSNDIYKPKKKQNDLRNFKICL